MFNCTALLFCSTNAGGTVSMCGSIMGGDVQWQCDRGEDVPRGWCGVRVVFSTSSGNMKIHTVARRMWPGTM